MPVMTIKSGVLRKLWEAAFVIGKNCAVFAVIFVVIQASIIVVVLRTCLVYNRIVNIGIWKLNPSDRILIGGFFKFGCFLRKRFCWQSCYHICVLAVPFRFQCASQLVDSDKVNQLCHAWNALFFCTLQHILHCLLLYIYSGSIFRILYTWCSRFGNAALIGKEIPCSACNQCYRNNAAN